MSAPVIPPQKPLVQKSNTLAYVLVVLGVVFVALAAIVLVVVARPQGDNLPLITIILAFSGTSIASIAALIKSERVETKVDEVHLSLNSRLTAWMEDMARSADARAAAARAEGVVEGQAARPPQEP